MLDIEFKWMRNEASKNYGFFFFKIMDIIAHNISFNFILSCNLYNIFEASAYI